MEESDCVNKGLKPEWFVMKRNVDGSFDKKEAADHIQPGEESALTAEETQADERYSYVTASDVNFYRLELLLK